eukprot:maker-scaffold38_size502422-snap-gene-0.17 protein:Tk05857 transcript:maker-scaffold38_size502422-snap-gene-0.17-mRNA-1 annotation:"c3orf68 homolog"
MVQTQEVRMVKVQGGSPRTELSNQASHPLGPLEPFSTMSQDAQPPPNSEKDHPAPEKRIFASHMYTGPLSLGDPYYRKLSNMEQDPMITQRMRDIARELCPIPVKAMNECGKKHGLLSAFKCRPERDDIVECIGSWLEKDGFRATVAEEYLNERSHYRQTGKKTKRYSKGHFMGRDREKDPPLDEQGNYRPQKPSGWDESYPNGQPDWAQFQYARH